MEEIVIPNSSRSKYGPTAEAATEQSIGDQSAQEVLGKHGISTIIDSKGSFSVLSYSPSWIVSGEQSRLRQLSLITQHYDSDIIIV